ncbi:hypothetical protein Mame01_36760 [Microbispora amethystogenes]|nr:hypothetical protein Mame01_36760 [Microbispora amethystogenes]
MAWDAGATAGAFPAACAVGINAIAAMTDAAVTINLALTTESSINVYFRGRVVPEYRDIIRPSEPLEGFNE